MDSDTTILIPPEFSRLLHLRTMKFIGTERPWLNLYGNRVRPFSPYGITSYEPVDDPALIHRSLPDELLMEVFARMGPYSLGRAACVCRKWRHSLRIPSFWRNACLKAWQLCGVAANYKLVMSMYEGSWRKMWLQRPRIRLDGIYVSRNTYIRAGVAEWKVTNPVHVVCYFRYLRFYPSGKFLYKITSGKIREVAKSMQLRALKPDSEIYKGDYILADDQVEAALLYPGLSRTLLRMRLRLRGTTLGANNRMDLLKLVTTGVNESEIRDDDVDMLGVVQGWQEDETHDPDVPAVTHKRGMTPFVFVPFEEAETSELNLPVEKMDFYVPG